MSKNTVVKKFGGTSVGSIERIENVAQRIERDVQRGESPILVISAMSGETNRLVDLGQKIDPNNRGPSYDMLLASGEQVAISLVAMALEKRGLKAKPMLAYQVGVLTDSLYSKARITNIKQDLLSKCISEGVIPVIAGFQGVDEDFNITTLGRGGSDTSAVAVAAAMGARSCEIYTDVPAIFSADPRVVPKAREIQKISYEEMMEMASLGSKVMHIRSVELGAKYKVRIHVRSSLVEREGSWIVSDEEIIGDSKMEQLAVTGITNDAGTVIMKLSSEDASAMSPQWTAGLFAKLSQRGVSVDIISQTGDGLKAVLAFSVSQEDWTLAQNSLAEFLKDQQIKVEAVPKKAKVSIVGVGMRNHPGVAAKFFKVLAVLNIKPDLITTSEIKISVVVDQEVMSPLVQSLHTEFELDRASDA